MNTLLEYNMGPCVRAFSTRRNAELPCAVCRPHQTHTNRVERVDSLAQGYNPDVDDASHPLYGVDAVVTNVEGLCLAVRTADCVPVLLYDPVQRAVAAVHAGWRGTVADIVGKSLQKMAEEYGTKASDVRAVVGPSIGPLSFEVGQEVLDEFLLAGFPMDKLITKPVTPPQSTGKGIDLWAANAWLLERAGVQLHNIQVAGIDTLTDESFFSARRETIKCGRITNAICLQREG